MGAAVLAAAMAWAVPAGADTTDVAVYLRARAAEGAGAIGPAAAGYARVLATAPGDTGVALRTYRAALATGNVRTAEQAAAILRRSGDAPADIALLSLGSAAARGDAAGAAAAARGLAGTPLAVLLPALDGWIAHAGGRVPTRPTDAGDDVVTRRLAAESRALLMIAEGHPAEGADAVAALAGSDPAADLRLGAAALLYGAGSADRAAALIAGDDPTFVALRRQPVAAKPTLAFGVSWLLTRVAADLIAADPGPVAIAFARTALIASPGNDRARLLVAAMLARDGDAHAALATLDGVAADGAFAEPAVALRITILADRGDVEGALTLAKARASRPDAGVADWSAYADRLLVAGRAADAVPWYARTVDGPGASAWLAWMQYGAALDEAGDWRKARTALERAVALGPDRALALNYLGYAMVEHGEDRARALTLLERAAAIAPGDASITDSLGWARFKTGDAAGSLPLVERAAQVSPTNAEIGLHLGDIYWALGRRYEARYAWRAAALTATGDDAAALSRRLADGAPATT